MKLRLRLALLLCLVLSVGAFGQTKIILNDGFDDTYFYKIDSKQAFKIFDKTFETSDSSLFQHLSYTQGRLADTLPLKVGNYLKVNLMGSKFSYQYLPITPWRADVLNNDLDLNVQILDLKNGKPMEVTSVKLGNKKLQFDKKTRTYILRKNQKVGILSITDKENTFYYSISKNNERWNGNDYFQTRVSVLANKILYHGSLRYLTLPYKISYLALPDVLNSLCYGRDYGLMWDFKYYYNNFFNTYRREDRSRDRFKAFFYFNKPIYRQGDTVKFKVHIKKYRTGKWVDKPILVYLNPSYSKDIYLGKITSTKRGAGYDFEFKLNDSFGLKLDDNYSVTLKDLDSNEIGQDYFRYEDYELKKAVFKIKLADGNDQIKGKPFNVNFTAKDENGLPMPDTRATIKIAVFNVSNITSNQIFIPDTIWNYTTTISKGDQNILIPDSIFPEADIYYKLSATLQNSENERKDLNEFVNYQPKANNLKLEADDDRIKIYRTPENNELLRIYANDRFDLLVLDTVVKTPCFIPLNPFASTYFGESENGDYEELDINKEKSGVVASADRRRDSIFCTLTNLRKLPVAWYLYKGNKEIKRGNEKDFPFSMASDENSNYFFSLEYIWAGKTQKELFKIGFYKNELKLKVEQPSVTTPGKETAINITALDYKDRPLKNVNLLAYSYTSKFDVSAPTKMPLYSGYHVRRKMQDNFDLDKLRENGKDKNSKPLNYTFWNTKLSLDTNWTYRFRYPSKDSIEYTIVPMKDSVTQIAPFVMMDGEPQPIQYVIIDNIPVYLGFTDKKVPYSFYVDTNYHQIKIRTRQKLLIMDSAKFKPYVKTLFSIDQTQNTSLFKAIEFADSFSIEEKNTLSTYVFKYSMPANSLKYAYLERSPDEGQYFDLSNDFDNQNVMVNHTIGPIYWHYWNFKKYSGLSVPFEYEPYYTYSFDSNLVKMKSNSMKELLPRNFNGVVPDINDEYATKAKLLNYYEHCIYEKRRKQSFESVNSKFTGNANLYIDQNLKTNESYPINIILGKPEDFNFLKVLPGNTTEIKNIPPGKYQLLFIDGYNYYRKSGVIDVQENGTNFYRIQKTDTVKGANAAKIDQILNDLLLSPDYKSESNLSMLMNEYVKATFLGSSNVCSGIILDSGGEPAIGATIKIHGTNIGAMTDMDGKFEIEIPSNIDAKLDIMALGFKTVIADATPHMKIRLTEMDNTLTAVMITVPYSPSVAKEKYVGSADVVTIGYSAKSMQSFSITRAVEGAVAGVVVTGSDGAVIEIRKKDSITSSITPLIIINGAPFDGDITTIDPSIIESINISKDATTTNLYGSRGSNGVIMITIKKDVELPENIKKGLEENPMSPDMLVSGMRHNFKDDAYWLPDLVTDENGKASFKVTFPDDITNWQTIVIGVDDKLHTGQAFSNIKSYKPIAASLYLPHFLLDGDTALLVGKSVNYVPDSIPATTTFYQDDSLKMEHKLKLGAYYSDTLLATALGSDSVKLKYLLTKEDGYFDGEERTIPLERIGVKVAEGGFQALDMKDTSFTIYPTKRSDTLHLAATASLVDVVLDEIEVVRDYGYLCNEQMASKILALLSKQKMHALLHKDFNQKDKDYINQLLGKIGKNQNSNHLWGWWENGSTVNWISNHVLHAIVESKALGYSCNVDLKPITDAYIFDLERDTVYTNIPMLQTLAESGLALNFEKYISRLERNKKLPFNDYLDLVLLRQQLHLPYKLDRLNNLKEEDIFGNIYWRDTGRFVYNNEVLTTVKALKIIQNDSTNSIHKSKIINWLLQQRGHRGWRNTYESVQVIEAIAPYLPLNDTAALKPTLKIDGGIQEVVATFPYQKAQLLSAPLLIHKTGAAPVYFTWYYNKWDTSNASLGNSFKIKSYFETKQKAIDYLPAGEPVTMKVNVQVDKSAEYVMLEIPIPAGCSYQSKPQPYYNHEIHREYFENKVSIFCDALPKGNYTFDVELLPRFHGKYTLNPAKAELMYFPVFYGREIIKKVEIKP